MAAKPLFISLCTAFTLLAAQPAAADIVWKDQTVKTTAVPQKIAVYDLSALDILNTLGVPAAIVPDASFPATLKNYTNSRAVKAGTLFEPDTAVLNAQKPDLVIIGGRSSAAREKLGSLPILDLSPDTANYMADLQARSRLLGDVFGKRQAADAALQRIAAKQAKLKAQTRGKTALMLFTNKGNFMPHAEGERFGFVYDFAGLSPVLPAAEARAPGQAAPQRPAPGQAAPQRPDPDSPEAKAAKAKADARLQNAVNQQPDYLIVLDRGAVPDGKYTALTQIRQNPILSKAKGKVIMVDANAWYLTGAGLANTELMLDELLKGTK